MDAYRLQEEMFCVGAPATPGVVVSAADEATTLAWLKAPDLLGRIAADIAAFGVIGKAENALTVYLAALSRKLDRPLAVLIQSTSAAGKSALMDAVLKGSGLEYFRSNSEVGIYLNKF